MKRKLILLFLIIGLTIFISACGGDNAVEDNSSTAPDSASQSNGVSANLDVTSGYGQESIFSGETAFDGSTTVMDLLTKNVEVDSAYGGSFINGINGLISGYTGGKGEKKDWFFYVNGIISPVGAGDYHLSNGDRVWWDYHLWGDTSFTPAVIGSYPQPFINGFLGENPGTLILTGSGFEADGEALAQSLAALGVENITLDAYSIDKLSDNGKIVIVVAPWQELSEDEFLSGAQENRDKTGLFISLSEDVFISLDDKGSEVESFTTGSGALFATGTGLGDTSPIWVVTGTDSDGTKNALNILLEKQESIAGKFAVIVDSSGNIHELPVQR